MRVALGVTLALAAVLGSPATASSDVLPGQLVVRFAPSADAADRERARDAVGATVEEVLPVPGTQLLDLDEGVSVREADAAFERRRGVVYAEPNFRAVPDAAVHDPRRGDQWYLDKIEAPRAWDALPQGGAGVVAAVIGSGVEVRHPDLRDAIWRNPGEAGDGRESNGVDDDANGYVDDWRGWRFTYGSFRGIDPTDPSDYDGHETGAAGVLGAVGDNGTGIAGVGRGARIMPLNWWDVGSAGMAQAIDYAADKGVRIANASVGMARSQAVEDAIAAAPDLLLFVSAGNQGWDVEQNPGARYPCVSKLPNVVCVAATNGSDELVSWSNWGAESVDLAAPGEHLWTTSLPRRSVLGEEFTTPLEGRWTTGGTGGAWAITTGDDEFSTSNHGSFLADSPGGAYPDDADTWIATEPLDLREHRECWLNTWLAHDLAPGDVLRLEASRDGAAFETLREFTRYDTWAYFGDALTAYEDAELRLRFRLTSDAAGTARGVRVQRLTVWCDEPPYRGTEYGPASGTSFASPVAAGVATLVLATRPSLTTAELKAAVLDSGDPVPALAGRTVSGRRLNARRAVGLPEPGPGSSEASASGSPDRGAGDLTTSPPVAPRAVDARAPACRPSLPPRVRPRSLASGSLRVAVRCDEASGLRAVLSVSRVTARALGVGVRRARVVLGTRVLAVPGSRDVALRIRVGRRWASGLRAARRVRARLRVTATDAAGNVGTRTVRLTLRRPGGDL